MRAASGIRHVWHNCEIWWKTFGYSVEIKAGQIKKQNSSTDSNRKIFRVKAELFSTEQEYLRYPAYLFRNMLYCMGMARIVDMQNTVKDRSPIQRLDVSPCILNYFPRHSGQITAGIQ
jgi:hypothetical protein